MFRIKKLKNIFNFLLDDGFALSFSKTHVTFSLEYLKHPLLILITYDYRDKLFMVGYKDVRTMIFFSNLLETTVGDPVLRANLLSLSSNIASQALKSNKDISETNFNQMASAYAVFIRSNLDAIKQLCS